MSPRSENHARILVVEDENNLRRLFVQYLARQKYAVDEAESGENALKKIASHDYDLVVTDLQMAAISGLEVLQAVKQKDRLAQVLIVTGYGSVTTAVKAMQQGAYDYLTKPMHLDALGVKVKNALERRQLLLTLHEQQQKIESQRQALERDLELACQVHASLVPEQFINSWMRISVQYKPMIGLGGDFADIYQDHNDNVYISVIDVTGHGIAAALIVNRVCSELRKLVRESLTPKEIIYHLNDSFISTFADTGLFLTMMSIKCERASKQLTYAGGAHPAALLWNHRQQQFSLLHSQNPIIGFDKMNADSFIEDQVTISEQDRLYLYTDGLLEVEDKQEKPLGLTGLLNFIRPGSNKDAVTAAPLITEKVIQYGRGQVGDDLLLLVADFL
ncbi:SpoIIE family protein phosphatase [candidate division KSB1 bacterium]|nr:SpoIIE family protein phosphatase [candidate division KSB1 bacterium]